VREWLIVMDADAKPIRISALQLIGASPYSVVGHTAGASVDLGTRSPSARYRARA
jgi:hypothetical protein